MTTIPKLSSDQLQHLARIFSDKASAVLFESTAVVDKTEKAYAETRALIDQTTGIKREFYEKYALPPSRTSPLKNFSSLGSMSEDLILTKNQATRCTDIFNRHLRGGQDLIVVDAEKIVRSPEVDYCALLGKQLFSAFISAGLMPAEDVPPALEKINFGEASIYMPNPEFESKKWRVNSHIARYPVSTLSDIRNLPDDVKNKVQQEAWRISGQTTSTRITGGHYRIDFPYEQ